MSNLRKYQLSMLQVFVAAAVVAVTLSINLIEQRTVGNRKSTGFKVDLVRQGWPFTHRLGLEFTNVIEGKDRISSVQFFNSPKLAANVSVVTALLAIAVFAAGKVKGKSSVLNSPTS